jgi:expansin (peptidoglycan-binding protein)
VLVRDDSTAMVAAINAADWAGSALCGRYVRVTGPLGFVDVRIVDQCPGCVAGDLDLNLPAFSVIANPILGRVPITWQTIEEPSPGAISYHVLNGSNIFFMLIQPRHARYGVAKVEYLAPSGYVELPRTTFNAFQLDGSLGIPLPIVSPFTLRMTDVNGSVVTESGLSMLPDSTQQGSAQFPVCATLSAPGDRAPATLALRAAMPNPFPRSTSIEFELARSGPVSLQIFDASGRLVRTLVSEMRAAGRHRVAWEGLDDAGREAVSGVYFARLVSGPRVARQRLVLTD